MELPKFEIPHSLKNIPLPSSAEYLEAFVDKISKFLHNLLWDAFHKFNENNNTITSKKNTYGFKSKYAPPPINRKNYGEHFKVFEGFSNDIYGLVRKIKFNNNTNEFLKELKVLKNKINKTEDLIVQADKTSNFYTMKPQDYREKKHTEITKTYKKSDLQAVQKVDEESAKLAAKLELDDRMQKFRKNEAFVSVKDHKSNYREKVSQGNVPLRLINPAKSDMGVVSKQILQKIIETVMEETNLNYWSSTWSTLNWYENLAKDKKFTFLIYDIENFYPNIKKEVLLKALKWAEQFCVISELDKEIIMQSRKSFLIEDGQPWVKKEDPDFDVTQGSFDSCQVCELVGIYLLSEISKFVPKEHHGVYRDDGLLALPENAGEHERIRKKLVKLFKDNGFSIEAHINMKQVDFLDANLNMKTREYKPFKKENSVTQYVHKDSNHWSKTIESIEKGVNVRLNKLSSNQKVFEEEIPSYREALQKSGHSGDSLKWNPEINNNIKKKRVRRRKVHWCNIPYSSNVDQPMGRMVLQAVDKWFPKNHFLHRFYNRNTIKVSYSTTRNLKAIVDAHNRKILNPPEQEKDRCNCQKNKKKDCPIPGQCQARNIIYKAEVTVHGINGSWVMTYYGQTSRPFKIRFYEHKQAMKNESSTKETALSRFIWKLKNEGKNFDINWSIHARAQTYQSGSKKCQLCTKEKLAIALHDPNTLLNNRKEILGKCIHVRNFELRNPKTPP